MKFRPFLLFIFIGYLLLSTVACSDSDDNRHSPVDGSLRNLTFVYIMAENSLSSYATSDLLEMKMAANVIPDDCELLVFIDDVKHPRICRMHHNGKTAQCDTIHSFKNDFSSSDIENARMVFSWVNERYPAQTMNVVLWSHGSGWVTGNKVRNKSLGMDNEKNDYSNYTSAALDIDELSLLLSELKVKPTVLLFDACFMQTIETAYELRNSAEWIIASPAEIPAKGAPYDILMEHLFAKDIDPIAIVDAYCSDYLNKREGVVLSVIDCNAMEQFAKDCAEYIPVAFNRSKGDANTAFSYLKGGYYLGGASRYPDYSDLNAVMKNNLDASLYNEWRKSLANVVLYKATTGSWYSALHRKYYTVDKDVYCGVSMYLPREGEDNLYYNTDFVSTSWYSAAGWGQAGW